MALAGAHRRGREARPTTNFSKPSYRNSAGAFAMRASASSPFSNKARRNTFTGSSAPGKTAQFLTLNAAPIDIAPVLRRMLFRDDCSCVMTSATLAVGRADLAYFRDRIGADEAEPVQLGSPFDFQKQMKLVRRAKNARPARRRLRGSAGEIGSRILSRKPTGAPLFFSPVIAGCSCSPSEMERFFARRK